MKKTALLFLFKCFLFISVSSLLFSSCKKEGDVDTAAADNAMAEGYFADIHNISDEAGTYGITNAYKLNPDAMQVTGVPCAKITIDSSLNPAKTITIDFGTSNCLCKDGRQRRGKIMVKFSGSYGATGTVITITPSSYFVNENEIRGTKTIKNNGKNTAGFLTYDITVDGTIVLSNGNGTIYWKSSRTRTWIQGDNTPLVWTDDIYLITGSATGTNAKGNNYSVNITKDLRRELNCRYFVSGSVEVTPDGKPVRVLDYGAGTCDDQATIAVGGKTHTITLF